MSLIRPISNIFKIIMTILKATVDNITKASRILNRGGLVIYPTDTVYGLGCDPFNIDAVKLIFKTKGDRKKPLPILASDIESIEKIAFLSRRARKLASKFWPGPLTLVLPKKSILPDVVTCNLGSVGVRIPMHDIANQLIRMSGGLLVGTSANKTGEIPARTAYEATALLGKEVKLILDAGPAPLGTSSTIVDLTSKTKILRIGPISLKDVLNELNTVSL